MTDLSKLNELKHLSAQEFDAELGKLLMAQHEERVKLFAEANKKPEKKAASDSKKK